ncbi:unnamed protein product, partial [Darwinula stevensoni]
MGQLWMAEFKMRESTQNVRLSDTKAPPQTESAQDVSKRAITNVVFMAPAQHLKAIIYAQMGQTDLAIRDYAKAVQMNPSDPDILNNY